MLSSGKTVEHSQSLMLTSVSRQDEGLYICTASNGVGSPASASVKLTVLCKNISYNLLCRHVVHYNLMRLPVQQMFLQF